jgi:hypothetical protein
LAEFEEAKYLQCYLLPSEVDATRTEIDAIRVETAALYRRIEKLGAQNAKLQVLVYFIFVTLLLVLLVKLVK